MFFSDSCRRKLFQTSANETTKSLTNETASSFVNCDKQYVTEKFFEDLNNYFFVSMNFVLI